jgi:hypothetical protein
MRVVWSQCGNILVLSTLEHWFRLCYPHKAAKQRTQGLNGPHLRETDKTHTVEHCSGGSCEYRWFEDVSVDANSHSTTGVRG